MTQTKSNFKKLFKRVSDAIELLSDDELDKLADPNCQIEIRAVRRRSKDEIDTPSVDINIEEIIKELSVHATRNDAQYFLDSKCPNKKALEMIAKRLDILVVRQDKVEVLRDKIIESTVGARIRSHAIQGTSS